MSDTLPAITLDDDGIARRAGQLRPALKAALHAMVENGLNQREAAELVGMQADSLTIALRRPHVQAYVADVKRAWLANATGVAWRTVSKLMTDGKSEDVRLKAARTVLEAAGELGGPDGNPSERAQTVINIVMKSQGQHAPTPDSGVIEAPLRNITPRHDLAPPISLDDE